MKYLLFVLILLALQQPALAEREKVLNEGLKQPGIGAAGGDAGTVGGGIISQRIDQEQRAKRNKAWDKFCKRYTKHLRCLNDALRYGDPPKVQ